MQNLSTSELSGQEQALHTVPARSSQDTALVYRNFASKPSAEFLGVSVVEQKMFMVQTGVVSVFEYFCTKNSSSRHNVPYMIKEIILPFQIRSFQVTPNFILIKSDTKIQIRDLDFEQIFLDQNVKTQPEVHEWKEHFPNSFQDWKEQASLKELTSTIEADDFIVWLAVHKSPSENIIADSLICERVNLLTKERRLIVIPKEEISPKVDPKQFSLRPPHLFGKVGCMEDFYFWAVSDHQIEMGVCYLDKQQSKQYRLFEINTLEVSEDLSIQRIFFHSCRSPVQEQKISSPVEDGCIQEEVPIKESDFLIVVAEKKSYPKQTHDRGANVHVLVYQISSSISQSPDASVNKIDQYLEQLCWLQKHDTVDSNTNMTTNAIFNEIIQQSSRTQKYNKTRSSSILKSQLHLGDSFPFDKAVFDHKTATLWVSSAGNTQSNVSKISYEFSDEVRSTVEKFESNNNREFLQVYESVPLFTQKAVCLDIGFAFEQEDQNILNKHEAAYLQLIEQEKNDQEQIQDLCEQPYQEGTQPYKSSNRQSEDLLGAVPQADLARNFSFGDKATNKAQTVHESCQTHEADYTSVEIQTDPVSLGFGCHEEESGASRSFEFSLDGLNFQKIEDTLIRFSNLFRNGLNKSVSKLRESNKAAKDEIKCQLESLIKQLSTTTIEPLLNESISTKLVKEFQPVLSHCEKVFTKQISQFNEKMQENNVKEESKLKEILQQQIQSTEIIKESSAQFLDVTSAREMGRIAYNQLVIETINNLTQSVDSLHSEVLRVKKEASESEEKIIKEIAQINQLAKDIALATSDSSEDSSEASCDSQERSESYKNQAEQAVSSEFSSQSQVQEQFEVKGQNSRHFKLQKRVKDYPIPRNRSESSEDWQEEFYPRKIENMRRYQDFQFWRKSNPYAQMRPNIGPSNRFAMNPHMMNYPSSYQGMSYPVIDPYFLRRQASIPNPPYPVNYGYINPYQHGKARNIYKRKERFRMSKNDHDVARLKQARGQGHDGRRKSDKYQTKSRKTSLKDRI